MSENAHISILRTQIANLLTPYANEMDDQRLGEFLALSLGRVLINKYKNATQDLQISNNELRHITDWIKAAIVNETSWLSNLDADQRPKKLMKFSTIEQIVQEADKSMLKASQKLSHIQIKEGDEELFAELQEGYYVVKLLTPAALDRESAQMQHCIGQGSYDNDLNNPEMLFLSLRDSSGKPHVTMEINNQDIHQLQGKQNQIPLRKYIDILAPFININLFREGEGFDARDLGYVVDDEGIWHDYNKLEKNFIFNGCLVLSCHEDLKEFPDGFQILGNADLNATNLKNLPNRMQVDGDLNVSETELKKLPNNLKVTEDLNIKDTDIRELPSDIIVSGCIVIDEGQITLEGIPDGINLGIYLRTDNHNVITLSKYKEMLESGNSYTGGLYE